MLLVLFNIGTERFGLDAQDLREILPAVALRPVHGMPTGVVGLLLRLAGLGSGVVSSMGLLLRADRILVFALHTRE